jgi:hypothetical protein
MRGDAKKVLCLRPRVGGERQQNREFRRKCQNAAEAPKKVSMRRKRTRGGRVKTFGEYLPALKGFLAKAVGRSWDSVYSEISARCDKRSATGLHAFQHIYIWVALDVEMVGGLPHYRIVRSYSDAQVAIQSTPRELQLYVHPDTGILTRAPMRKAVRKTAKPKDAIRLGPNREYRKREGIWYYVEYGIPPASNTQWEKVQFVMYSSFWRAYCAPDCVVYVKQLRQLSSKELRKAKLTNT